MLEEVKLDRLSALSLAWCSLDETSVTFLCSSFPLSVAKLDLGGRMELTDENVRVLIGAVLFPS